MRELDNVIICKSSNLQKVLLFDTKFENLVEIKSSIFKGGFRWVIASCEQLLLTFNL
jgi:hypothetical protein